MIWKKIMSNPKKLSKEEVAKILQESSKQLIEKSYLSTPKQEPAKEQTPDPPKQSFFQKAKSFTKSMISRGVSDKKCSTETKELRHHSCHGNISMGLVPCDKRKGSSVFQGSFYCGACGCGDKKSTQLTNIKVNGSELYSKLDYPFVACPLKMPGFSNYDSTEKNFRKEMIESKFGIDYIVKHSAKK